MDLRLLATEYDTGEHNSHVIDTKMTVTYDNIIHKGVIEQYIV